MATPSQLKPRVFIDADVLFAGAASPSEHAASLVVLRMGEITLIDAVTSMQAIVEAERNLEAKLPRALPAFRLLVTRCLNVQPTPLAAELMPYTGFAHPKDLSILVAAIQNRCSWLCTFNGRHFQPGYPNLTVLTPGAFVGHVRDQLVFMDSSNPPSTGS